jgi:hypothetical protein
MKKLLFFLLALAAFQAKAQVIRGSIAFKDSTISRSIPVEVAAGMKSIKFTVKVYLAVGEVTVALTDPNGKKAAGGFSLNTHTKGGGNEPSKGELSADETPKVAGTWKFTIRAKEATGTFNYKIEVIEP